MILVSACLAGINSRYDGKNSEVKSIVGLVKEGRGIPLCPELLGGLQVPRACCEIGKDEDGSRKIHSCDGQDYTENFKQGAQRTLEVVKALDIRKVVLKSKSPSCGCGTIYDGTFSGTMIKGNGITAQLLLDYGVRVYTEDEVEELINEYIEEGKK